MLTKSQDEIMASWDASWVEPVVSVCCTAFNHEDFVGDALDSILNQITHFPFEILIHDDASNDDTVRILKQYQSEFPEIIKPVYQVKNKWQLGIRINPTFNFTRAKGQFIAICEGDDFWVSTDKLQKQVSYMLNSPTVSLTFHQSKVLRENQNQTTLSEDYRPEQKFTISDIVENWFIYTQTMVIRLSAIDNMEKFFNGVVNVDWSLQLVAAHNGDVVYLPNLLSVYRKHHGSLSKAILANPRKRCVNLLRLFMSFDNYSNNKYRGIIERKMLSLLSETSMIEKQNWCRKYYYLPCPDIFAQKLFRKLSTLYNSITFLKKV